MENAKEYYDKTSREYVQKWQDMDRQSTFNASFYFRKKIMETVLEMARVEKNDRVVELGCGTGLVLRELLKKTGRVFGTDISPEMLKRVQDSTLKDKKVIIAENFLEADARHRDAEVLLMPNGISKLDLPKNYFDKMLSVEVLRYVDDLENALCNVAAVMKMDSRYIFTITNFWSSSLFPVKFSIRKILGLVKPQKELLQYFVTERSIRRYLKNAGLEVVEFRKMGLLFAKPLIKKFIKNQAVAEKIYKLDKALSGKPVLGKFADTFVIAVKKSASL